MKKRYFIIIAILIFIIVIICIPYLLNSPLGRKVVLSKLSQNTQYALEAENMYLSWLGPQRAKNLKAISSNGIQYVFPELSLDIPFWELYKETPSIGTARIFNPTVTIPEVNHKTESSDKVLDSVISTHKKFSPTSSCKIFGKADITDGKIYWKGWQGYIDIPKLQYICSPDGVTLRADAKFPNGNNLSHVEIVSSAGIQNFQLKGRDIPSGLLGLFVGTWCGLSTEDLFGRKVNIDSTVELINSSGPISFNLDSPQVSLTQSGALYRGRYLLDKPLTMSMQISDKIIDCILPQSTLQIDPIPRPITITIGPQEIALPLSFCTEVKDAILHIGKITCANKNLLFDIATQVLGINDSKIDLWFSDIPICYADGILRLARFEILLQNKYPLAMWGKIDCFQNKVNLTLAITESTLRKVFGIKSLSPDYVITCPIKGSFDDIQVDIGKLIKRLSILFAKEKTKKQLWKEGNNFSEKPTISPPPIQSIPWDKDK